MGTNYKSNGTISIKHLLKMKDEVNEKSLKEIGKSVIEFIVGDQYSFDVGRATSMMINSSIKECIVGDWGNKTQIFVDLDNDHNLIKMYNHNRGDPQWLLGLIEYYSNVKIWNENDLLDIEDWIGQNSKWIDPILEEGGYFEDHYDMVK